MRFMAILASRHRCSFDGLTRRIALAVFVAAGSGQAQKPAPGDVIFELRFDEKLAGEGLQYSLQVEGRYTLMPLNDDSARFDPRARSSLDLYRIRGGFLGLKPGEKLGFYAIEETASGRATESGQPPCDGKHILSRDGRLMSYTNGKASLWEQRSTLPGVTPPVQYSVVAEATLVRTATGAVLSYSPRTVINGCDHLHGALYSQGFVEADKARLGSFVLTESELKNWAQVQQTKQGAARIGDDESVAIRVSLAGSRVAAAEEEMVFEPGAEYDSWLPAPAADLMPGIGYAAPWKAGTPLLVKVRILPKKEGDVARKAVINFDLEGVTRHKGRCGNYPRNGLEKDDMRFAAEQAAGIVVDSAKTAHTAEEVSEATIAIEAMDTAGYARLTARASALGLKAIYKPTNTYALTIPRDDDGNKIADAWERQVGAQSNVEADRDTVEGQKRAGDGLTVFDEYRGLVTLEDGRKVFRRLDPNVKELLVIDPEGLFSTTTWFEASKVRAHKLDESMVAGTGGEEASRVVNFNAEDNAHSKYVVRVKKLWAKDDPDGDKNQRAGLTPCGECRSPKDADYCGVVVDRVRAKVERLHEKLSRAVANPGGPEAEEAAAAGIPAWQQVEALRQLGDPAARTALADQLVRTVILHEVGHAVGARDHDGTPPEAHRQAVMACPMFYPGARSELWFIVLQILYRPNAPLSMQYREFCRGFTAPGHDTCFDHINLADW